MNVGISTQLINIFPGLLPTPPSNGIKSAYKQGDSILLSNQWEGGEVRKARLCWLNIPGKFFAETLVIYPQCAYDYPIFGCEYLNIGGKKFFGAVDFHPISKTKNYSDEFLSIFPDTLKDSSKFYDLKEYFSNKFWIKTQKIPFYNEEYLPTITSYLQSYSTCLKSQLSHPGDFTLAQDNYDIHMAKNDPARGILKAYFSENFAENYINNFLFTTNA